MANYVLACVGGLLYSLGVPNLISSHWVYGPPILALILLFLLWRKTQRLRDRCLLLFIFSIVANGLMFFWLPLSVEHYSLATRFAVLLVGISLVFSSFANLWVFLFLQVGLRPLFERKAAPGKYVNPARVGAPTRAIFFKVHTTLFNIFLAGILTMLEFLLPQTLPNYVGFSWLNLAPHLGLIAIFGLPILSFLTYLTVAIVSQRLVSKSWDWPLLVIVGSLLLVNVVLPPRSSSVATQIHIDAIPMSVEGAYAAGKAKASVVQFFERPPLSLFAPLINSLRPTLGRTPETASTLHYTAQHRPFLRMRTYDSLFAEFWRKQLSIGPEDPQFIVSMTDLPYLKNSTTAMAQLAFVSFGLGLSTLHFGLASALCALPDFVLRVTQELRLRSLTALGMTTETGPSLPSGG